MISLVRKKLVNNSLYKIFLWIFLFMMALGSGASLFQTGSIENWEIKTYKQTMTKQEFQNKLSLAKRQQEMFKQKGYFNPAQNLKKETVQGSVSELLSKHIMDKISLKVPSDQIESGIKKQLAHLPSYFFNENGQLNQDAFNQQFAPHTVDDFAASVETEIKSKVLYGIIDAGIYVPEFETSLQYTTDFAQKTYSYLTLSNEKYLAIAKESKPSTEALQKFYKKSQVSEVFKTAETRQGVMWTFDSSSYGSAISESDVKSFYDKNKAKRYLVSPAKMQIRTLFIKNDVADEAQAKSKIEELRQEAEKTPDQFETLVRKFSQDKVSAARGGLSDFFEQDDKKLSKMVVSTAFEYLSTDGQISAPIKTEDGYELIQRVARQAAKYKDVKSVESEIKKELTVERFKKRFSQDASRVITGAKYHPEALMKFISSHGGSKTEISLSSRKPGLDFTYLFKTEEGRFATFFDKDNGVILTCSKVVKSVIPELSEVSGKVLAMYYEQKASELMQKDLVLALKDARNMSLDQVAKKYGASVAKASFTYKDEKAEQSSILKEPTVAAKLKGMQHEGALVSVETKAGGVVLKLDNIAPRDEKHFIDQKGHLGASLFYMKMYQIKDGFIASLYRTAKLNNKIEIKADLLNLTKEV
jgi:parvulin-like peptidyl-prolyl isomerase